MEIRTLTDDDVEAAASVFVTSLGSPVPKDVDAFTARFRRYWDVEHSLGAFEDDRLLGVAATFPSTFTAVGGARLDCAVVPSVGVRPDAHGRGVGGALLRRQVAEARDRGAQVMALNASEVWIYGRYGYGPTSRWWSIETDPRMLRWRTDAPRTAPGSVTEHTPSDSVEAVADLHDRCVGRWGGELARPPDMWATLVMGRPDRPTPTVALHHDADGALDAAATFVVKQGFDDNGFANTVEVLDLIGLDLQAEAELARWLCERNLVGKLTADRWNPRSPIPWMLEDPRRWRTTTDADAAWVRVLDLPGVVTARPAGSRGHVTVAVRDPLVVDNDRTWRLGGDDDGSLTCEPSDAEPQLTLGVELLPPLLWGYATASTLAAGGRVEVRDPSALPALDRLLAVDQPSWCSTPF